MQMAKKPPISNPSFVFDQSYSNYFSAKTDFFLSFNQTKSNSESENVFSQSADNLKLPVFGYFSNP